MPTAAAPRCSTSNTRRLVSQIVTNDCTTSVGPIHAFGPRRDAQNAAITFTNTYFNGNRNGDLYLKTGTAIAVTNNATSKNEAAEPRP